MVDDGGGGGGDGKTDVVVITIASFNASACFRFAVPARKKKRKIALKTVGLQEYHTRTSKKANDNLESGIENAEIQKLFSSSISSVPALPLLYGTITRRATIRVRVQHRGDHMMVPVQIPGPVPEK